MTTGVLLYSFNSENLLYSNMTKRCIRHIKKHLDLPVTVVGDTEFDGANNIVITPTAGNKRQYNDKKMNWYNLERPNAYDHSPYDTTILMDCDYFVMSDYLLSMSTAIDDILIHDRVHDITQQNNLWHPTDSLLPLVWATVVIFKKTEFVRKVFDMIKHVKDYYHHYRNLYRIRFDNYRNDYAFAIALHQMYGGYTKTYCLPEPMMMIGKDVNVVELTDNSLTYQWGDRYAEIHGHDIHVFNKEYFQ